MSAAAPRPTPRFTVDDLRALPEDADVELIDGEIVERAQPRFEHGRAQGTVRARLDGFERRPGGREPGGWWLATEVTVEYSMHRAFRHDLAGWRRERVVACPSGRYTPIIPDWACVILSPSNAANDRVKKFRALQAHAVPFYWIVDLDGGHLTVYRFGNGVYEVAAVVVPGERARLPPFEAVEIEIAVLFGADPIDERPAGD